MRETPPELATLEHIVARLAADEGACGDQSDDGAGTKGCFVVTDATGAQSVDSADLDNAAWQRDGGCDGPPSQSRRRRWPRALLCLAADRGSAFAELGWVSLPGTAAASPALRFHATLQAGEFDNGKLCPRGDSAGTTVLVVAALGRQPVAAEAGRADNGFIAAVWAGDVASVARLALPGWLQPPSVSLRSVWRGARTNDDGDAAELAAGDDHATPTHAVVVTVPRQSVPAPTAHVGDLLDRYDAAVSRADAANSAGTPFSVGGTATDPTYGEISTEGALAVFEAVGLGRSDVFYDLGSGDGRVVVLAAVLRGVSRAVGVELDGDRHGLAARGLVRAAEGGAVTTDEAERVAFLNGDAFAPGAVAGSTVVYMLSNVFPDELFSRFLDAVGALSASDQRALRCVVTSRSIPPALLRGFNNARGGVAGVTLSPAPGVVWVATSWTPSLSVRLYDVALLGNGTGAGGSRGAGCRGRG